MQFKRLEILRLRYWQGAQKFGFLKLQKLGRSSLFVPSSPWRKQENLEQFSLSVLGLKGGVLLNFSKF